MSDYKKKRSDLHAAKRSLRRWELALSKQRKTLLRASQEKKHVERIRLNSIEIKTENQRNKVISIALRLKVLKKEEESRLICLIRLLEQKNVLLKQSCPTFQQDPQKHNRTMSIVRNNEKEIRKYQGQLKLARQEE